MNHLETNASDMMPDNLDTTDDFYAELKRLHQKLSSKYVNLIYNALRYAATKEDQDRVWENYAECFYREEDALLQQWGFPARLWEKMK